MDMRLLPEAARMQVLERRCAMTTNYEWLLHMDGAERQAWFDAEHVEFECPNDAGEASMMSVEAFIAEHNNSLTQDVCETDTAESVPQESLSDTREKLEADVLDAGCADEIDYDRIVGWLDRQAAIDRKEFQTILEEIQKCVRNGSR